MVGMQLMNQNLDNFLSANKRHWDDAATVHYKSSYYDVDGFVNGGVTLSPIELSELGDVNNKDLLHLQCHIGLDTLSWARKGAKVTGIDFSSESIKLANDLTREISLQDKARFIESDVYDLQKHLDKKFDIVFTSHGVLNWLPDLGLWANTINNFIKPNGLFYIIDIHPYSWIFDDTEFRVKNSYFGTSNPDIWVSDGTYAIKSSEIKNKKTYLWQHTLGEVISALANVGLNVEFVHEFPFCSYKMWPFLEKNTDGFWYMPKDYPAIPMLFSLKATKQN